MLSIGSICTATRRDMAPRLSEAPRFVTLARCSAGGAGSLRGTMKIASIRRSSPVAHVPRREPLGRDDDPAQPVCVERKAGSVLGGARLDLDEGEDSAAACDDVDLAAGDPSPPGEDPPAVQPEPHRRERFGAAAALFGLLARFTSSVRGRGRKRACAAHSAARATSAAARDGDSRVSASSSAASSSESLAACAAWGGPTTITISPLGGASA